MLHRRRAAAMITAIALVACGCSASPAPSPPPNPDGWTERAAAPSGRTEVAAAVLGGRIWVLGGMGDSGRPATEVAVYDPGADRWTAGPPLPQGVHHASAAGDGSRLWLAGGYVDADGAHVPTDAVRVIDSATGTWTDGPPLPSPRGAGALAWDGTRLVFAGGVGPAGLAGDVFALENGTWLRLGALGTAREHLAAASDGRGNTWLLAGRLGGLDTNRADVDLVTGSNVVRAGAIPTPRGGVAGFHAPNIGPCVAGGEQPTGTFDEVECLRPDGTPVSLPALGKRRHGLAAAVLDGVAYALLGGPSPGLTTTPTIEALKL